MCEYCLHIVEISSISTCFKFDRFQVFFHVHRSSLLFSGANNKKPLTKNVQKKDFLNPDYFYIFASLSRALLPSVGRLFYVFSGVHFLVVMFIIFDYMACGYLRTRKTKIRTRVVFSLCPALCHAPAFFQRVHLVLVESGQNLKFRSELYDERCSKQQPTEVCFKWVPVSHYSIL